MDAESTTTSTVLTVLQFGIGVGLIAYSVAHLTDTITYRPPAVVSIAVGIGLMLYGLWMTQRS
ncbi:hypothetical protein [Halorhabdus sp. CUG00001]|uniref:hypothetical protein n=1 Tax=Halorhabdus sp. CUG00001 TaxID=2600297 RepID=UPI00131C5F85|nr:hypothetical protein [Halorhabdus sp. CUG00001]